MDFRVAQVLDEKANSLALCVGRENSRVRASAFRVEEQIRLHDFPLLVYASIRRKDDPAVPSGPIPTNARTFRSMVGTCHTFTLDP